MDLKDLQYWNHWKLQQLHASFQADFIHFVSQIYWFWEVWGDHFSSILGLGTSLFHYFGDHWVQGCTQTGPEWIFSDFWWILGLPLETLLEHFFRFSLIWTVQNDSWIAVTFFVDFEWKFWWILMSQPFKSIVNSSVFIRFHFFDFLMILMILGTCLDLIWVTFGGHVETQRLQWCLVAPRSRRRRLRDPVPVLAPPKKSYCLVLHVFLLIKVAHFLWALAHQENDKVKSAS